MGLPARRALVAGVFSAGAIGCSLLLGDGYTGGGGLDAGPDARDALADVDVDAGTDSGVSCRPNAAVDEGAPWPLATGCQSNIGQSTLPGPRTTPIVRWSKTAVAPASDFGPLALSRDKVLVGAEHPTAGVAAYSFEGELLWTAAVGNSCCGGLAIAQNGDVFAGTGYVLARILGTDGGLLATSTDLKGEVDTAPILTKDGAVYIGSVSASTGTLYGAHASTLGVDFSVRVDGGAVGTPAITRDDRIVFAGTDGLVRAFLPGGAVSWTRDIGRSSHNTVATDDDAVYVIGDDGILVALGVDGSPRWTFDTGGFERGTERAIAVAIARDGTLYVPTKTGLVALAPNGTKKWTYAAPGQVTATPVVDSEGTIFVVNVDSIHAVTAAGATRWPPVHFMGTLPNPVVVGPDRRLYLSTQKPGIVQAFAEP